MEGIDEFSCKYLYLHIDINISSYIHTYIHTYIYIYTGSVEGMDEFETDEENLEAFLKSFNKKSRMFCTEVCVCLCMYMFRTHDTERFSSTALLDRTLKSKSHSHTRQMCVYKSATFNIWTYSVY